MYSSALWSCLLIMHSLFRTSNCYSLCISWCWKRTDNEVVLCINLCFKHTHFLLLQVLSKCLTNSFRADQETGVYHGLLLYLTETSSFLDSADKMEASVSASVQQVCICCKISLVWFEWVNFIVFGCLRKLPTSIDLDFCKKKLWYLFL